MVAGTESENLLYMSRSYLHHVLSAAIGPSHVLLPCRRGECEIGIVAHETGEPGYP